MKTYYVFFVSTYLCVYFCVSIVVCLICQDKERELMMKVEFLLEREKASG